VRGQNKTKKNGEKAQAWGERAEASSRADAFFALSVLAPASSAAGLVLKIANPKARHSTSR